MSETKKKNNNNKGPRRQPTSALSISKIDYDAAIEKFRSQPLMRVKFDDKKEAGEDKDRYHLSPADFKEFNKQRKQLGLTKEQSSTRPKKNRPSSPKKNQQQTKKGRPKNNNNRQRGGRVFSTYGNPGQHSPEPLFILDDDRKMIICKTAEAHRQLKGALLYSETVRGDGKTDIGVPGETVDTAFKHPYTEKQLAPERDAKEPTLTFTEQKDYLHASILARRLQERVNAEREVFSRQIISLGKRADVVDLIIAKLAATNRQTRFLEGLGYHIWKNEKDGTYSLFVENDIKFKEGQETMREVERIRKEVEQKPAQVTFSIAAKPKQPAPSSSSSSSTKKKKKKEGRK